MCVRLCVSNKEKASVSSCAIWGFASALPPVCVGCRQVGGQAGRPCRVARAAASPWPSAQRTDKGIYTDSQAQTETHSSRQAGTARRASTAASQGLAFGQARPLRPSVAFLPPALGVSSRTASSQRTPCPGRVRFSTPRRRLVAVHRMAGTSGIADVCRRSAAFCSLPAIHHPTPLRLANYHHHYHHHTALRRPLCASS